MYYLTCIRRFPSRKVLADFLGGCFLSDIPRLVVIADFLGGWFGSFSWCMLVFSMCFQPIFLVDIFWQIFFMGSLADFLADETCSPN